MDKRFSKQEPANFSALSPWEIEPEESCINKYCSDLVQSWKYNHQGKTNPKVKNKPRAVSTCSNIRKRERTHQPELHEKINQIDQSQKIKVNKFPNSMQKENSHLNQKPFHTISQLRTDRVERKKIDRPQNVLQEITVKNFIIEGGQDKNQNKEKYLKKRESSYVMKQKFAQFRRSTKQMLVVNKENGNLRVIRYDN